MLETIQQVDSSWVMAVNGLHRPWLDEVMIIISLKQVWFPLYLLLVWILVREQGWKNAFYSVLFLVGAITLSDQTASSLFKPFFQRLRPCHEPGLQPWLHLPDGCGGQFGFASSHASNSFCVAFYFILLLFRNHRLLLWLFPWAIVIGISRIYLGAHYPTDVLMGAAIGILWAWCCVLVLRKVRPAV